MVWQFTCHVVFFPRKKGISQCCVDYFACVFLAYFPRISWEANPRFWQLHANNETATTTEPLGRKNNKQNIKTTFTLLLPRRGPVKYTLCSVINDNIDTSRTCQILLHVQFNESWPLWLRGKPVSILALVLRKHMVVSCKMKINWGSASQGKRVSTGSTTKALPILACILHRSYSTLHHIFADTNPPLLTMTNQP